MTKQTQRSGTGHPVTLSYSLASPWWKSRWVRRWIAISTLLAFIAAGWRFGPDAWNSAHEWYWERRCMSFNPPAATVVYERLPFGSAKPINVPDYKSEVTAERSDWIAMIQNLAPLSMALSRAPICAVGFLDAHLHRTTPTNWGSILFCHALTNPAGGSRLVIVLMSKRPFPGLLLADSMDAEVFGSPTPHGIFRNSRGGRPIPMLPFPRRFFAGQLDPKDATHFTIEYEWPNGVHGFIDGWLRADDHVDFSCRPGPGDPQSALESFEKNPAAWVEK